MNRIASALLLVAGLGAPPLQAQQDALPEQPSTALVLGGGGARGIAHVGVVAGLERIGWDADLVVGTSMGAIIGAFYAAGMPADTIVRLIRRQDWGEMFSPPAKRVGPGRDLRRPVLRAALDLEGSRFKEGFIPDWRINRLLTRSLFDAGARARGDFDRLPRRFRAVAADLATGEEVVLASGDVARAARASMAVPGVFSPVLLAGEVLVDGGVSDYLPVAPARELGARAVIAVDVIRPPDELRRLGPVAVAERSIRLLLRNALPGAAAPDLLLVPDIPEGHSSATFPREPGPLIEAGVETLTGIAAEDLPGGIGGGRPLRGLEPPPELRGLLVEGARRVEPLVRRAFSEPAAAAYDPAAVLRAVDRLYATGLFTGVWVTVDAQDRLVVRTELIPAAALQGALGWDSDQGVRAWGELHRRALLLGAPGEAEIGGSLARDDAFGSLALRRISLGVPELAWSIGGHLRKTDARQVIDGSILSESIVRRAGGWLALEYRRLEPGVAAVLAAVGEHVDAPLAGDGPSLGGLLRIEGVPPHAAVVGLPPRLELEARGSEVAYWRAALRLGIPASAGPLLLAAYADAARVDEAAPPDVRPALGDGPGIPGLRWGEGRGRSRVLLGVDAGYPILLEGHARLRLAAGRAWSATGLDTAPEEWVGGAELAGVWVTPWGPLEVRLGRSSRDQWRFDVSVGPVF